MPINLSSVLGAVNQVPRRRGITIVFAVGLVGIVWYRNTSTPAAIEQVKPNPASAAAAFDPASVESDQQLLPDRYNLAFQQLISLRAQQIKADASREISDRRHRCFNQTPIICVEGKLKDLNQKLTDAVGADGSLTVSPSRALSLNVEAQSILTALRGLGVKDANTERLAQIYLRATGGEFTDLSGIAASIRGSDEYLDQRRVDRLTAAGKMEDIPEFQRRKPNAPQNALAP